MFFQLPRRCFGSTRSASGQEPTWPRVTPRSSIIGMRNAVRRCRTIDMHHCRASRTPRLSRGPKEIAPIRPSARSYRIRGGHDEIARSRAWSASAVIAHIVAADVRTGSRSRTLTAPRCSGLARSIGDDRAPACRAADRRKRLFRDPRFPSP